MKHFLWAALALPLAFAACDLGNTGGDDDTGKNVGNGNPTDGGVDANGVDWTDYQTKGSYSIFVRNDAGVNLVAFMDNLSEGQKLGGVKKNSGAHGFKMNEGLFNRTKDFSIIFLTEEKYNQNKSNLTSQEQTPFTRIYAFYNKDSNNELPFAISGRLGGNNKFRVQNSTSFDIEFRENSADEGIPLGFVRKNSVNTTFYMNDADFFMFPVFKRYNALTDEVISIFPKRADGKSIGLQAAFQNGEELTINAETYLRNSNGYSMGAALLVIQNRSGNGVSIYNGFKTLRTETGMETVNHGADRAFTIRMNGSARDGYDPSYDITGWNVVEMGTNELALDISSFFPDGSPEKSNRLESDYRYTIIIGGNWNDGNEEIRSVTKSANKITENFFN